MIDLFIDESGSMTCEFAEYNPYFIISILKVDNKKVLKRAFRRFVSKHFEELKKSPKANKMFNNGKFIELKGSALTGKLKRDFIKYFSKFNDCFNLFLIKIDNSKIDKKFYTNTARAFNYAIKLALTYFINCGYIPKGQKMFLQIDERNQSTDSRSSLEDYLNTELHLASDLTNEIKVSYFDSSNNILIQMSDIFANLEFSRLQTGSYVEEFNLLEETGILKKEFVFPKN